MGDVVPNPMLPLKKFAEQMSKFAEKYKTGVIREERKNHHRGIDYKETDDA